MCDTFVALSETTRDGAVLFGKNSDRDPNEAQEVVCLPSEEHPAGTMLRCTYIDIPQAPRTNAVLLCKPFWMWGAEMGANQHGVVIGNEAVFTREPVPKTGVLTGMDLLRLGLERASCAEEALGIITVLLERYGQGGNCGFSHEFYYHNSFLIADRQDAWVLETSGKEWAAERVRELRSISNRLSIHDRWEKASPGLEASARERGWCANGETFDFARCYSDRLYTWAGASAHRQSCTERLLSARRGDLTPADAMRVLRAHGQAHDPGWRPDRAILGAEVCMHAGFGPVRISQTTGSLVVHLTADMLTCWVTATAAPCTSIFKPLWLDVRRPWDEPAPRGEYDPACLWWRHEKVHRGVLLDYPARMARLGEQRDHLEAEFIAQVESCSPELESRQTLADACFQRAELAEIEWLAAIEQVSPAPSAFYYRLAWEGFNRQAGLRLE